VQEQKQEQYVPLLELVLVAKALRRQGPWPELVLVVKGLGRAPAVKVLGWLELVRGLLQLPLTLVMLQGLVLYIAELAMAPELLLDLAALVMAQIPPLVATELHARAR